MIRELLPDFFNFRLLVSPDLLGALGKCYHVLKDRSGNVLSKHGAEGIVEPSHDLVVDGTPFGSVEASDTLAKTLVPMLQACLQAELSALRQKVSSEEESMLAMDIEGLLRLSENEDFSLEGLLLNFLKLMRCHIWVERASIFGIYDGFTLEGLAGVGAPSDVTDWKLTFSSVAGIAATTRKPYFSDNPAKDPNFQKKEGASVPRNLLCFPLLHGDTLVGVLNLSNRIGGGFTESDQAKVARFARAAAHILQKYYFKKRMQSFERESGHLGKYLSSKVVSNVKQKSQLELGGVEKKVVCLFSDIRGYTSITENIKPATLVQLLNFHFDRMHAIIEKYEGTLDKIVGDLIMAVWNIPNDQPEPELLAMKTAIEMQKEMIRSVIPEWNRAGVEKVGMGVGVNAGLAIVGNLGSTRFMNYTVIGDAINTTQRLESKAGAGEVWMAEHLFPFVSGKLEKPVRKETQIKLKGKDKAIDAYVYRPLGY